MISKVFLSIIVVGLLAVLGLIALTNTTSNCWDAYVTEQQAITNCEQHE
jgi:hypothetical protein